MSRRPGRSWSTGRRTKPEVNNEMNKRKENRRNSKAVRIVNSTQRRRKGGGRRKRTLYRESDT